MIQDCLTSHLCCKLEMCKVSNTIQLTKEIRGKQYSEEEKRQQQKYFNNQSPVIYVSEWTGSSLSLDLDSSLSTPSE